MVINRSHLPWALLAGALTLALGAVFMELFHPGVIPNYIPVPDSLGRFPAGRRSVGATPLGLAYGTAAFLIFIFATLLGPRKQKRHWRVGSARAWLRAHIWLSILTIPLVLFHCGFRMGSFMTSGLMALYGLVMSSGFYGLALQQFMPRLMTERLSHEFIYDEIPFIEKRLVEAASEMREELARMEPGADGPPAFAAASGAPALIGRKVEESGVAVLRVLEGDVIPYLRATRGERHRLGRAEFSEHLFRMLKISVREDLRSKVNEIERWCVQRRQIDLQLTLHRWLHYWLFFHAPASLALLVWTGWHAISGMYFY